MALFGISLVCCEMFPIWYSRVIVHDRRSPYTHGSCLHLLSCVTYLGMGRRRAHLLLALVICRAVSRHDLSHQLVINRTNS